jgi:hypothetical protein
MNNLKDIPWITLRKGLPRVRRSADDWAPTIEEIRKIIEYPDRRIKAIVCIMASSGIRVGAWDYLKFKHIIPLERAGQIVAAIHTVQLKSTLFKKHCLNIWYGLRWGRPWLCGMAFQK